MFNYGHIPKSQLGKGKILIPVVISEENVSWRLISLLCDSCLGVSFCSEKDVRDDDVVFKMNEDVDIIEITQKGKPNRYIHVECFNEDGLQLLLSGEPPASSWRPPILDGISKKVISLVSRADTNRLN